MTPARVLFVCVENSNRSQMAEAFARILGGGRVEAFSAGRRPSGRVNPKAVAAMAELGYDLTAHTSKGLAPFNGQPFDAAVTMGCGDACPLVDARRRIDWQIPDPRIRSRTWRYCSGGRSFGSGICHSSRRRAFTSGQASPHPIVTATSIARPSNASSGLDVCVVRS